MAIASVSHVLWIALGVVVLVVTRLSWINFGRKR